MIFGTKHKEKQDEVNYLPSANLLSLLLENNPTNAAALDLLFLQRYRSYYLQCPQCGFYSNFSRTQAEERGLQNSFICSVSFCEYIINPLKGTVFEPKTYIGRYNNRRQAPSSRPLIRWFQALNVLRNDPTASIMTLNKAMGLSAVPNKSTMQLKRELLSMLPKS